MKNLKLNIAVLLVLLLAISSCQKEDILTESITKPEEFQFHEGMIQLGEKLENPYTVENMRKAYQNLSDNQLKSANVNESDIDVTHLYVRFLPKNFEELEVLKRDTTLALFDFPLDYEIEEGGTYYQDPELPDTTITWQYCAVETGFLFPNIQYEILAELFLPETMEDSVDLKSSNIWTFWDDLEVEALRITDNLEESSNQKSTMGRKKWNPSGTITVNGTPLIGCKARAYSWFTTKENHTNSKGEFYISHKFKGHVNSSIKWERNYWSIRSSTWGQAYYNGPRKKQQRWNLDITSGKSLRYAIIHRAAYDYFYRNPFSTQIPFEKKWYRSDLKIGYYDKLKGNKAADYAKWRNWLTWPHIRIYKGELSTASTTDIYATTIHELAHCAHMQKIIIAKGSNRISDYYNADKKLIESWAVGMQVAFTRHFVFSSYNRDNYIDPYTNIVSRLLKEGYTLKQLEDALVDASTWNEWKDNIVDKYENINETKLDSIFDWF
jgi:hypothetical protein